MSLFKQSTASALAIKLEQQSNNKISKINITQNDEKKRIKTTTTKLERPSCWQVQLYTHLKRFSFLEACSALD